jgi:hypothetical protein
MQYIKVKWIHNFPNEPVLLLSELDDGRMEIRKIEIYRDGFVAFADRSDEIGETRISTEAIPTIEEIASDAKFLPEAISAQVFEHYWSLRGMSTEL